MSVGGTVVAARARGGGEKPAIRNLSIMASAGSGKTYQLSSRFLQLVFLGAEPGSILASTFTRVAAGEIRDRILQRLAEAADDEAKRRELAEAVKASTRRSAGTSNGGRAGLSRDEVLEALARLTRHLHRLHVRTLDSFFAQVVRCFALELGIDPAAQIVDADLDHEMRREAIEMMLDERDPQPLIDLLRVLSDGTESRRVSEMIDEEMRALYEVYREAPAAAWEAIDPWKPLDRDELESAIERLAGTPPSSGKRFINAHEGDCEAARAARAHSADDWKGFIGRGLTKAIVFNGADYYKKPIEPAVVGAYEPLIDHAKAVIRNAIVDRTRSTHALLERFHARYEESKLRHKSMTFSDVTAKMAATMAAVGSERARRTADDICFRLDATLRHILLDEMQDTSVQQWRALAEIVRAVVSEPPPERSFFCVGDVKQSIYGWREANPEILAEMPNLLRELGGSAEQETLPQSWRSSRVVLEAVDRVLIDTRPYAALESLPDAVHDWAGAYEPHEPKRDLPGYVELRTSRRADRAAGENQTLVRLCDAADLVERLHRATPNRSIGVLTRTNETVSCLLYELGPSQRNLDAAGRGGGSLTDAAAVNAVLDLLRLADHPGHTVAAFNVIHSPLGEAIGFTDLMQCARFARDVRRALLGEGYARTIGRWIETIGLRCDSRELRRLVQLQQLAGRFDARATLRTSDFLALVDATVIPDAGAAPIQVMTIHQAKGLEFDVVVLPDLDQAITRTSGMKIVVERDSVGEITRVARHPGKDAWRLFDDLAPMYDQQITRAARDSLCALYVAMTRPRHALHMLIDPSAVNERSMPKTLAGIVRGALADGPRIDPETTLFAHGDETWHALAPAADVERPADAARARPARIELAAASGEVPRGRERASASALHEAAGAEMTLTLPDSAARERGTAIHAMFEAIEWIDAFEADEEALVRIALRIAPRRGREWARDQARAFREMIARPAVRGALAREQGAVKLWRELPFARLVDGAIQRSVIDRLTARYDESGRCAAAAVLDFKTDRVERTGVGERAEHYRAQLQAYRRAASAMLGLDESAISMRVLFVACGEQVEL